MTRDHVAPVTRSVESWVSQASDERERCLRQAVHTVLHAIARSPQLRGSMLIKGGMLLAIGYGNDRFTTDVDFSTDTQMRSFDVAAFLDELEVQLTEAVEMLEQDLDCRVQSHQMKPAGPGVSFPTLTIKVGYSRFGSPEHQRLIRKGCPNVLAIDYSLNEIQLFEPAEIVLGHGGSVQAYSLPDLIGEKYRAMLQQEVRNRFRGQDVYDIHRLLIDSALAVESNEELRSQVHLSLVEKSATRDIGLDAYSIRADTLMERLERNYGDLRLTVESLPPFEDAYERVARYYESLPWSV